MATFIASRRSKWARRLRGRAARMGLAFDAQEELFLERFRVLWVVGRRDEAR